MKGPCNQLQSPLFLFPDRPAKRVYLMQDPVKLALVVDGIAGINGRKKRDDVALCI